MTFVERLVPLEQSADTLSVVHSTRLTVTGINHLLPGHLHSSAIYQCVQIRLLLGKLLHHRQTSVFASNVSLDTDGFSIGIEVQLTI